MHIIKTQPKIGRRAIGVIIDYALVFNIINAFIAYYFLVPKEGGGYEISNVGLALDGIFWFIYFPIQEYFRGQTLGKQFLGLKVVSLDGSKISIVQAIKRRILDIIDFPLYGIVAAISVKKTKYNQRLGDLWAGTLIVGNEKTRCYNCRQEMILNYNETIKGTFECSNCKVENSFE